MLKALLPVLALTTLLPTANAFEFEPSNNSALTKACLAAIEPGMSVEKALRQNALRTVSKSEVLCNDKPIADFAREYKADDASNKIINAKFASSNESTETQICIAAATSNTKFQETTERLSSSASLSEIQCNGMTLSKFAKQYNKSFNG